MGTFRSELERLTRLFVAGVISAVEEEARRELAQRRALAKRTEREPPRRVLRSPPAATVKAAEPAVVRVETIVVPSWPQGRRRRRRASTGMVGERRRQPKVVPPKPAAPITFEVVPHPVRAGRRLVMTRVG